MKKTGIIISIVAGLSIVLSSLILGISFYNTKGHEKSIYVVGLAEKDFISDLIVWDVSLNVIKMDLKEAYSEIKSQNAAIKEYLISKGIKEDEMVFEPISTRKDYRYEWDNKISRNIQYFNGYSLTQTIAIKSKEVEKIEKITREVSELLDKGMQLNVNSPEYYYTKLADLKIEMLANAAKDARKRAETVAANAGAKLGRLKSANMGVFQITAPNSSEEDYSWGGAFNTSSKEKRASINMRLTYKVK